MASRIVARDEPEGNLGVVLLEVLHHSVQLFSQSSVGHTSLSAALPPALRNPSGKPLGRSLDDVCQVRGYNDTAPAFQVPWTELQGSDHGPQLGCIAGRVVVMAIGTLNLEWEANCATLVAAVLEKRISSDGSAMASLENETAAAGGGKVWEDRVPIVPAAPVDDNQDLSAVVSVDEPGLVEPDDSLQWEMGLGGLVPELWFEDSSAGDIGIPVEVLIGGLPVAGAVRPLTPGEN